MNGSWLVQAPAAHSDQVAAGQLRRVLGAHAVQVHVLRIPGRQPLRFHALEQRGHRRGAIGRSAKADGLLDAAKRHLGDAALVAGVRLPTPVSWPPGGLTLQRPVRDLGRRRTPPRALRPSVCRSSSPRVPARSRSPFGSFVGSPKTSSSTWMPRLPTSLRMAVPLVPESLTGLSSARAIFSPTVTPPSAEVLDSGELACPQPYRTAKDTSTNSRRDAKFSP